MEKRKATYSVRAFRYGMTNGFTTLLTTVASTYWAVYLTGAVGLETAVMASILSIASFCDLVSVPICGIILQKVRFKSGKFRPWLIYAGVAAAILRWLTFTDLGLTGAARGLWFGGTYILCYIAFNLAYSAFTGILPLMATDPSERLAYSSARTMCNSIGKFLFSLTSVTLVAVLGGGNDARGYSMLALLIAVLVAFGFIQLYFAAKDVDGPNKQNLQEKKGEQKPKDQYQASIWEMVKYTISKPFLLYLAGASCKGSAYMVITGLAAYYYTYVAGDKGMLTIYLSLSTFLMIGGSFIAPYVSKLIKGGKQTYIAGIAVYAACLGMAFFLGKSAVSFTILLCIGYIGYSIAHASEVAIYSTVIDYTQWKNGKDLKPFMMSLFSLTPKIGTTIGSIVMGYGLVAIGFNADNVTEGAVTGLRFLFSGIPCLLLILGIVCFVFFPLTDNKVREMQADIAKKKEMGQ